MLTETARIGFLGFVSHILIHDLQFPTLSLVRAEIVRPPVPRPLFERPRSFEQASYHRRSCRAVAMMYILRNVSRAINSYSSLSTQHPSCAYGIIRGFPPSRPACVCQGSMFRVESTLRQVRLFMVGVARPVRYSAPSAKKTTAPVVNSQSMPPGYTAERPQLSLP